MISFKKDMRIPVVRLLVVIMLILCSVPAPGAARDAAQRIPKTDKQVVIDGRMDEVTWKDAFVIDLPFETSPAVNAPAPVKTEAYLLFDDANLYIGVKCYDPEPAKILAHYSDRDISVDDLIRIELDTFNSERNSFGFGANPFGVQTDYLVFDSGVSYDYTWDAIFSTAGEITDWGYCLEFAIPFSSLRFQRTDDAQTWGILIRRTVPREVNRQLSNVSIDRNNSCSICQYAKIEGFEGARPGKSIELNPTITSVFTQERPDFPDGDFETANKESEAGLTAQWGVTPNLKVSGTINPDFSQVEADAFQLDINEPFALYYTEKRPFFTEGANYFSSILNTVHTRAMRDPIWGLKVTGREGDYSIGAYVVRDDITNIIFPGSQRSRSTSINEENTSTVISISRDVWNNSNIGVTITDREGDVYFNRAYGLDGNVRFGRSDNVFFQLMKSDTRYDDDIAARFGQPLGEFSDTAVDFKYFHDTRNVSFIVHYQDIGDDFRADLGYMPQVGYTKKAQAGAYTWIAPQDSWWSSFSIGEVTHFFDDSDGKLLHRDYRGYVQFYGKMRSYVYVRAMRFTKAYRDNQFDFDQLQAVTSFRPLGNLEVGVAAVVGDDIDYTNVRLGESVNFNPYFTFDYNKHIHLSVDHLFERMDVNDDRLYTANITQVGLRYNFNARMLLRAIFQYVNYEYNVDNYLVPMEPEFKQLFSQLIFSYKINARTVLFLGYKDNYYGGEEYGLTQFDRTVFAKIGYAWQL